VSYKRQELLTITDNTGERRQTRNQIDNPEKLTTQVHRTNTESNRQSRETDNTGAQGQTRTSEGELRYLLMVSSSSI
jgi:hypothetical protein